MKRLIKILRVLMLVFALQANAQNITRIQYFFDTADPAPGNTGNGAVAAIATPDTITTQNLSIPTTGLTDGLHTVYVRFCDVNGSWSMWSSTAFQIRTTPVIPDVSRAEYFIDTDPAAGNATAISPVTAGSTTTVSPSVPTTSLADGIHTLFVRFADGNNRWSMWSSTCFQTYTIPVIPDVSKAEYFYDTEPGAGSATAITPVTAGSTVQLSPSTPTGLLSTGLHTVYVRYADSKNRWGMWSSSAFSINPVPIDAQVAKAEYFFDSEPGAGSATSVSVTQGSTVVLTPSASTSALSTGLHNLYIRFKDTRGNWGIWSSAMFSVGKSFAPCGQPITNAESFIDTDPGVGSAIPVWLPISPPADSVYFDRNLFAPNSLANGTHYVYTRVKDGCNIWSDWERASFTVSGSTCALTANVTASAPYTFCPGDSVVLTENTFGDMNWQWKKNGTNIGTNSRSYTAKTTGSYTVTVTAKTGTCSASSTAQVVFGDDTTKPVITSCAADITGLVADAGQCSKATVSLGSTTATDNCLLQSVTNNAAPPYAVGTTTVTWTASDASGNTKTCAQHITVTDGQSPSFTSCPASPVTTCGTTATWTAPSAIDNCAVISLTGTHSSGATFPVGTTAVTFTATDAATNTANCNFNVVRYPTTSAVISGTKSICLGSSTKLYFTFTGTAPFTYYYTNGSQFFGPFTATTTSDSQTVAPSVVTTYTLFNVNDAHCSGSISGSATITFYNFTTTPAIPADIFGSGFVCIGDTKVYYVTNDPNIVTYTWTASPHVSILAGQGTNSVTVKFLNGYASSGINVYGTNCLASCHPRSLQVDKSVTPGIPTYIAGESVVCPGNYIYTVKSVPDGTFTWTAPAGSTITAGQGTNTITLAVASGFTTGTLSVKIVNCAGTGPVRTMKLVTVPPTPGGVTGQVNSICGTTTGIAYSIDAVSGSTTYQWVVTVTGGTAATIVSGQNTTGIVVDFPTVFTSAVVKVRAISSCAIAGPYRSITVYRKPEAPAAITGPAIACATASNTYSITAVSGASSYIWTAPAGWSITSGQGSTSVNVTAGTVAGTLKVAAINSCGTGNVIGLALTINTGCRLGAANDTDETTTQQTEQESQNGKTIVEVYPNPNTGNFSIQLSGVDEAVPVDIDMYDVTGKNVYSYRQLLPSNNEPFVIKQALELADGLYLLRVHNDAINFEKKVTIAK